MHMMRCLIATVAAALLLSGCYALQVYGSQIPRPFTYSSDAISGVVVDDPSGAPLGDVVVVAYWTLVSAVEAYPVDTFQILETTTDKNGAYTIPSWGPKTIVAPGVGLYSSSPHVLVFKVGYQVRRVGDSRPTALGVWPSGSQLTSEWNGKSIAIRYLGELENSYVKSLDDFGASTVWSIVLHSTNCQWKSMPLLLMRLEAERRRLGASGLHSNLVPLEALSKKCGA
jgi:hypothetical protein